MRKYFQIAILIMLFAGVLLNAITIPYSQTELKTETNHLSGFVRISPDDSLAIPLQTDVWLWHDKDNLHIFWEAEIDVNFEKGKLANTDEWTDCDFFRIQIITDVKNYYAYYFYSFPFGNKFDGIRNSDMRQNEDWNSNYKYENIISDNLWTSSIKIPLNDLRFYGNPPYKWKIILTRYFEKANDFYSFPYGKIDMGKDYFRTAYDITINEELSQNKNYRITPYFIKKYDLMEETGSFDPENIGLDFSYNPTSATKVKLSINPDFSDIPMDSESDNFNVRYAPSFEENRYFFIEDLDVFGVSSNLFYTRHIMQPQYAVKLTGNSENFSYGFLSAMDKKVVEDDEILNNDDIYNMLALRPKWENLSIQMTLLNRMNKDYHNEVFIINPTWEFMKNQSIWCELDATIKDGSDIEKKYGYSFYCGYNGKKGDVNWSIDGSHMSKDYNADMGRVYQTDYTALNADIWQNSEPNGKIIKKYGSAIWLHKAFENESKDLLGQNGGLNFWINSPHKINLSINGNIGQESYNDSVYTWDDIYAGIGTWNISWLSARISYSIGHSLVYNLSEIYKKDYLNLALWGDIGNNLSYNISAFQNFSNKLSITNGLRYNNYESGETKAYLGFFSNLRYEFKDSCNLYLGYKTAQDETEQEYITNYEQAYMKVRYTF
jgi:hypothetical protein